VLYVIVAAAGFVPGYLRYFAGARDIHWFAHLHGALMGAWLCLYVAQAALAASGAVRSHRALGLAGVALGAVIWISMCVASVRVRLAPIRPSTVPDVCPQAVPRRLRSRVAVLARRNRQRTSDS
jgi:hypothetical protein